VAARQQRRLVIYRPAKPAPILRRSLHRRSALAEGKRSGGDQQGTLPVGGGFFFPQRATPAGDLDELPAVLADSGGEGFGSLSIVVDLASLMRADSAVRADR